jgi:hypothetical protein
MRYFADRQIFRQRYKRREETMSITQVLKGAFMLNFAGAFGLAAEVRK